MTEVPQTGTKLKIDADRQFDGGPGDSTLRIQGQTQDGSQVFDATYVECATLEASLVGWFLRALRQPPPELIEEIAQEVQATYGSRLSGKDCHQIAETTWKGLTGMALDKLGISSPHQFERIEKIAERFERAAARSGSSPAMTMAGSQKSGRN